MAPVTVQRVWSGGAFEEPYGYCRALREGDRIIVAGTAPVWADGEVHPDPGVQARRCLELIAAALGELGGAPRHVVRTRMFVTDPAYADAVGAAHGEMFSPAPPAATMVVVAALLDPRWKVEIEAEAVVVD